MKVALVRALSVYGCFVKTEMSLRVGASVALKIAHSRFQFSIMGRVVVRFAERTNMGMGIEFPEIDPVDRVGLEGYLAELVREEKAVRPRHGRA